MPAHSSGAADFGSRRVVDAQHELVAGPRCARSSRRRWAAGRGGPCRCRSRVMPLTQYCSRPSSQACAVLAGVDHAADADHVADLEVLDVRANRADPADDLVARHHRVDAAAPFVAGLVQVGMAHAAVEDVDHHVVRARIAALERMRCQRGGGGLGGVALDVESHSSLLGRLGWERCSGKYAGRRFDRRSRILFESLPVPANAPRRSVCLTEDWAILLLPESPIFA